jgi:glycosyltransferase involved in cell wall biosynthesis
MNILLISPLCPLPLEKGGAVRIWNIAKQLSKHHTLDLVCFIRDDSEYVYEQELKKVFRDVTFIKRRKIVSPSVLLTRSFLTFFTLNFGLIYSVLHSVRRHSFLHVLYEHSSMKEFLLQADRDTKYDLLYAETYYVLASVYSVITRFTTPLLLVEQNIEWKAFRRQAEKMKVFFLKWLGTIDSFNMSVEEGYFWKHVPFLGGLSTADVADIQNETKRTDVLLLENGVDIGWFSEKVIERVQNEVLFVGNFSYFQNMDSLQWLLDEIWPRVVVRRADLVLRIVGRGASDELKQFVSSKGFAIDEGVDDIRTVFQRATMLVAPIRAGSGTKYKVLEAMASSLPVVTTAVGAEGLAVTSGTEVLIANSAEGLADTIVDLSGSALSLKQLGENGYNFVQNQYDWGSIVGKFEEDLQKSVERVIV